MQRNPGQEEMKALHKQEIQVRLRRIDGELVWLRLECRNHEQRAVIGVDAACQRFFLETASEELQLQALGQVFGGEFYAQ